MKEAPLNISIPTPCNQNWDAMVAAGEGKHCAKCNTFIYDFSQMTDDELLHFFKQKPATHCGRFHNTQLQRPILPSTPQKHFLPFRFNKVAATVFTLLSLKTSSSMAAKKVPVHSVVDANFSNKKIEASKAVITGTITNSDGKPLENAVVMFDAKQVAATDREGKFSFEVAAIEATSHNLYFSYQGLTTVVRTYHSVMLSTVFDISLQKPGEGFHTMGIMLPPWESVGELPSLAFKKGATVLNAEQKSILVNVAAKMKATPGATITVYAYPAGCGKKSMYQKRVDNVKTYLVESEGLAADRITTNCESNAGGCDLVDITTDKQNF